MNTSKLKFNIKLSTKEEIYSHLEECNNNFSPSLDKKVNIHDYSIKLFDKSVTFEAWESNILIGLVAAYFNDFENLTGYITNVSLTKDYMGAGIASKLINMCINYAKQSQFKEIKLEVLKNNSQAIHLYKKFGFEEFEEKENHMLMQLKLSNNDSSV